MEPLYRRVLKLIHTVGKQVMLFVPESVAREKGRDLTQFYDKYPTN